MPWESRVAASCHGCTGRTPSRLRQALAAAYASITSNTDASRGSTSDDHSALHLESKEELHLGSQTSVWGGDAQYYQLPIFNFRRPDSV